MTYGKKYPHMLACAILGASLLLPACGQQETEDDEKSASGVDESDVRTAIPNLNVLLVDLPSSIAGSQGSSLALQDEGEDEGGMENLFLMPREFVGMANQFSGMMREVFHHLFGKAACRDDDPSNDPADCADFPGIITGAISEDPTIFAIPDDPSDPGSPDYLKYYKNPAGSDYDYSFELYWQNPEDELYYLGLSMSLSKLSDDKAKGKGIFYLSVLPPDDESDDGGANIGSIVTSFDNTGDTTLLQLNLYDMDRSQDEQTPDRFGLKISLNSEGLLTGAGSVIRPEMSADQGSMAPFETKEEFAYVFKIAANSTDNVAVESIAFPNGEHFAEDDLFGNFGVDNIMKSFVLGFLRTSSDDWNCSTNGFIFGLDNDICESNTNVSDNDILTGVAEFCSNNPTHDLCTSPIGSYSDWANPLYLDADGFVGTENKNKPSGAEYEGLADQLATTEIYGPTDLKAETAPVAAEGLPTVD
ncbi:MAG: hypothetical protein ACOH5I_02910 [Oligoflexus sp.]